MTNFENTIQQYLESHWSYDTSFTIESGGYIDYCREEFIDRFRNYKYIGLNEFYIVKKYGIILSTAILDFINNFEDELGIQHTKLEQINNNIIKCSIDPFWKRTPVALSLLTYFLRYGHDNNFVGDFVGEYSEAARFVMNEYLTEGNNTFNRYSCSRSGILVASRKRTRII